MKNSPSTSPAEPFFLKTEFGDCFCLYHTPHPDKKCLGGFIYVHPFGEEMNKSRRMVALQARVFAAMGFGVLQIDLFGCGDSQGEFVNARWDIWKQNLEVARNWLEKRITAPISLWGLRLGALLALDFARSSKKKFERIILWQPVINGELFLTQFLRLRVANEMLGSTNEKSSGTKALRSSLAAGEQIEVAGYELTYELTSVIENLRAINLTVSEVFLDWFEIVSNSSRAMSPASRKVVKKWEKEKNGNLNVHLVLCTPFWATQEISECPGLVSATAEILTR